MSYRNEGLSGPTVCGCFVGSLRTPSWIRLEWLIDSVFALREGKLIKSIYVIVHYDALVQQK